jgi:hypothetical protein
MPPAFTAWGVIELHAVPLPLGEPVYVSRVDGDGPDELYVAACELAPMVGVDLER